jgi:signal transduction histidine kinase
MIDGDRDQLSEVIVELQKSDEHVLIDIQDNGPGKAKGTGLSLSICRQIIERHGGTIQLLDQDDCGTAFRIMLPGEMAFEWQGSRR